MVWKPSLSWNPTKSGSRPRQTIRSWASALQTWPSGGQGGRGTASGAEWLFGLFSLVVGLSILAALPIAQLLSLGYFLESSARVARTGRLRDGLIGVRRRRGSGAWSSGACCRCVPMWLVGSFAQSAELIDPGGPVRPGGDGTRPRDGPHHRAPPGRLRTGRAAASFPLAGGHAVLGQPGSSGRVGDSEGYAESRDGFWEFFAAFHLPHYFRLGFFGFLGTMAWIAIPASLIAASGRYPVLGFLGGFLLAFVAPSIPFLQVRYAVEGRFRSLFSLRSVRERFRRAPWAFAFALLVLVVASVPLYLLKIEMIPREAAWLPSLVFVIFLAPAHLLVGWAYARSWRRYRPRHWLVRGLGRLAILPVALFYVLIVVIAQYTSWGGIWSLYEQHAFLLPVPFLNM